MTNIFEYPTSTFDNSVTSGRTASLPNIYLSSLPSIRPSVANDWFWVNSYMMAFNVDLSAKTDQHDNFEFGLYDNGGDNLTWEIRLDLLNNTIYLKDFFGSRTLGIVSSGQFNIKILKQTERVEISSSIGSTSGTTLIQLNDELPIILALVGIPNNSRFIIHQPHMVNSFKLYPLSEI